MAISNGYYEVNAPGWWVQKLYWELSQRRPYINKMDNYYRGEFPLPWLADQAADEFRRLLKMARANYMGLVVDAQCERMAVEGFRINPKTTSQPLKIDTKSDDIGKADTDTWDIWQANNLDTFFDQGLLEAAITGQSYLLVAPNPKEPEYPYIWVEHCSQMIVCYVPGTNRRETAAALKVWIDDWTGQTFATLYLPDEIWKFKNNGQMAKPPIIGGPPLSFANEDMPVWSFRMDGGDGESEENPLGEVPVFELPNNPRLLTGGQSELHDLTDSQDRIVKTIADRLITQDFGAFPQKWASGWPQYNDKGELIPPIQIGQDRMLTSEVIETKFGQFAAADLKGFILAKPEDIKDIASRSRTPAQYLLGEMNNVNGDTLKASESGLVAKVRQRFRGHNDSLESAMRLSRRLAGLPAGADQKMETIWKNPEFRTEGELVDALLKMADLGVPEEALWERWGATPTEIDRWKAMLDDKMKRAAAGDATVVLADRFRQAAAPALEQPANGQSGGVTKPVTPSAASRGGGAVRGTQSGGNSSASARKRRPNAPKPSTT